MQRIQQSEFTVHLPMAWPKKDRKKKNQITYKNDGDKKIRNKKIHNPPKHHQEEANNEILMPNKEMKKKVRYGETEVVASEKVHNANVRNSRSVVTDPRFQSIHYDPKFQRFPKNRSKVTVDSRFDSMFTEKRFVGTSAPVDKRGRSRKAKLGNPLSHYYNQENERSREKGAELRDFEPKVSDDDEEDVDRSESDSVSDNSSDDGEGNDDEYSMTSDVAHYIMTGHDDTPRIEQPTRRIAVVNMDWDHIKAVDIYIVMASFVPKDGHILSVAVYPSQFGLECMEIENTQGPASLIYGADKSNEQDNESEEDLDEEMENEKIRMYELKKLRYYHAVVVCDSTTTANHLYKEIDGTEFLKTSNVFDLRFIPDSMEFIHSPRDIIKEAPASYTPPDFQTQALQHSKVKLSWDEDDPDLERRFKRKFDVDQLEDCDSDSLLAPYESENSEDEGPDASDDHIKKTREKYLALLQTSDHSDDNVNEDIEITFNTGLENLAKRIHEKKENNSDTVWQAYLKKRKEKRKSRKNNAKYSSDDDGSESDYEAAPVDPDQPDDFFVDETVKSEVKGYSERGRSQDHNKEQEASLAELELLCANGGREESPVAGDEKSLQKVKGKKLKKQLNEQRLPKEDYKQDPRFSGLLNSHLFVMDPTDPQFKRSATYARQVRQKHKHRDTSAQEQSNQPPDESSLRKVGEVNGDVLSSKNGNQELNCLVKSLKRKTSAFKTEKQVGEINADGISLKKRKQSKR